MIALAPSPNLESPFAFPRTPPIRSVSEDHNGKPRSGDARVGQKRALTPRASFSMSAGMERMIVRDGEGGEGGTPNARPRSWLRRLSSSMSTSRDSSRTPGSRPGSAAVSHSNGSLAFSQTGSMVPILPDTMPPALPPNKLVKRTPSLRSSTSSPLQSSGSKLPLPTFRRPATSHQRSAASHEMVLDGRYSDPVPIDGISPDARDTSRRQYFTPKLGIARFSSVTRRASTGIPNPIRRVYPDRRYTPTLVSARDPIQPAEAEFDDGLSSDGEEGAAIARLAIPPRTAPSSLPIQLTTNGESAAPRRAFSIGDLLSTGPQPLWRRPSQTTGSTSGSKLVRRSKRRVVSAPQAAMGSSLSRGIGVDSEPPVKRRDVTDSQAAQRSIYSSSSSDRHTTNHDVYSHHNVDPLDLQRFTAPNSPCVDESSDAHATSPLEQRIRPSEARWTSTSTTARVSAAPSEITSTVGSDSEYRSMGDASTDYQSDTIYDSYPTRTTRSSSGKRGPHIETIFDDSPPNFSSGSSTQLKDLLHDGTYVAGQHEIHYRHSTIEEEESIASTPVRSQREKSVTTTPSARPGAQQLFTSSPPAPPFMPEPDDIDWDAADDEPENGFGVRARLQTSAGHYHDQSPSFGFGPALHHHHLGSAGVTPQRHNADRSNLFDWSEAQPSPSHNSSPPRPKTVHGKKDPESRGSRSAGRRAPSGMHARSHSVPIVPDVEGKRSNAVANKFGTWGVGSKAVTEDWNEDFDFDEPPVPVWEDLKQDDKRIDSGHEMFVPRTIREQQENVVANIGLLREWGLLIEELKELRIRAVALDMMHGPFAESWQEVDAMIELADQESEEHTLEPRRSPPSSPGFDYGLFDESMQDVSSEAPFGQETTGQRESMAIASDSIADLQDMSPMARLPQQHASPARPRKDSEAVARSVIEALHSKRSVSEPTVLHDPPASKKVPFDTATLRHIVPYVNGLKCKVKDALRETEGLYSSPRRRTSQSMRSKESGIGGPPFRSPFAEHQADIRMGTRSPRREAAITDHDGSDETMFDHHVDLAHRMQKMNLPA